jgi:hypothetical protein
MSAEPITPPDEVSEYYSEPSAHWGQGAVPMGTTIDPIPAVYANDLCDEIQTGDFRFSLDEAERYAKRILNAVRYQQARINARAAEAVSS